MIKRRFAVARIAVALLIVISAIVLALPTTSQALESPAYSSNNNSNLKYSPSYKGYAYLANAAEIPAYTWTGTAWRKDSLKGGQSVYAWPYSGGFHWVYRDGSWKAVQSHYIRVWSCQGAGEWKQLKQDVQMYRYNASGSTIIGAMATGSWVYRQCSSSNFLDASTRDDISYCMAIGCPTPTYFALVQARAMPSCLIPATPTSPICMIAIPAGGFPYKQGYIKLTNGVLAD